MRRYLAVLLFIMAAAPAANAQNSSIYLEGTAVTPEQWSFFMENFGIEAPVLGYTVVSNKAEAAHTIRFNVVPSYEDPSVNYAIWITLISNKDNNEILSFSWLFNELDEMYAYNQLLLNKAVIYIPKDPPEIQTVVETVVETYVETVYEPVVETKIQEKYITVPENEDWRNKWLYALASFNYPITFYRLQSDGLIGGIGIYDGDYENPTRVSPLDNRVFALPGLTLGAELQFLNWMSAELDIVLNLGTADNIRYFIALTADTAVKFPIKMVKNLLLEPYIALSFPINRPSDFSAFPPVSAGGGIQAGTKVGPAGIIFADLHYIHAIGDAVRINLYGDLYPEPKGIHYRRSVLGIGIGYKYGFLDRKKYGIFYHTKIEQ